MQRTKHRGNMPKKTTNPAVDKALQDWHSIPKSKSLENRFEFLCENELMSDVHFVVGKGKDERKVPAHKFLLATRSPVFYSMFFGELAKPEGDAIEIPDMDPTSFLKLLRYIYCDKTTITPATVMSLLHASKKYRIPHLTKRCTDYLEILSRNLSPSNICIVLMQSIQFDEAELTEKSLQLIDQQTKDVFNQDNFTDLDLRTLQLVLIRDSLKIDEKLVFEAVERWSASECARQSLPVTPGNRRQVLGAALYLVRMPLMTPEDFTKGPLKSGMLTSVESDCVFAHFHDKSTKQTPLSQ